MLDSAPAVPLDRGRLAVVWRGPEAARADRLADGVWCLRLPLPYPSPRSVNAYLLDTADSQLLVDCGTGVGAGWDGLSRALSLAGSAPDRITTLLCTHLHTDHAAMAPLVIARTGCRLLRGPGPDVVNDFLRERSIPYEIRRAAALREGVPDHEVDVMIDATIAGDGTGPVPEPDARLTVGDRVSTLAGDWEVITATGHSPNQIALYDPHRRWLLAADVAYSSGLPYLEFGHTPDPLTEHLASIDRLAARPVDLFLPGHGAPDPAPAERLRAARQATLSWELRLRRVWPSGGATAYELTCALAGQDPDPDRRQTTLSVVLVVLHHLIRHEQARVDDDGPVRTYRLGRSAS